MKENELGLTEDELKEFRLMDIRAREDDIRERIAKAMTMNWRNPDLAHQEHMLEHYLDAHQWLHRFIVSVTYECMHTEGKDQEELDMDLEAFDALNLIHLVVEHFELGVIDHLRELQRAAGVEEFIG
jgi:hypothetical protein